MFLVDFAGDFAVGEIAHHRPAQGQSEVIANAAGQFGVARPVKSFMSSMRPILPRIAAAFQGGP